MHIHRIRIDSWLQRVWYGRSLFAKICSWLLRPFSWLFASIAALRRWGFRTGLLRTVRVGRPVVVVGNITVGGTGKTPFAIWLVQVLRERGYKPGVVTRGYGGKAANWPYQVTPDSDPLEVGDEAVLLAQRTKAIVVAGPDRVADAKRAIELGADIIVSDDGLQHYRLAREVEFAVVDSARGVGNGCRLPAGPLRESVHRLSDVDVVVVHHRDGAPPSNMRVGEVARVDVNSRLGDARSLTTGRRRSLAEFAGRRVHAVAGIGHPQAFFDALRRIGLTIDATALADHATITPADLHFGDTAAVLMTEKDAVKCQRFGDDRCWAVELTMQVTDEDCKRVLTVVGDAIRTPG